MRTFSSRVYQIRLALEELEADVKARGMYVADTLTGQGQADSDLTFAAESCSDLARRLRALRTTIERERDEIVNEKRVA